MSVVLTRDECIAQAELMLIEAAQDLAVAQNEQDLARLHIRVQMIQSYALLAQAKRAIV